MRGKRWFVAVLGLGAVALISTAPSLADQPVPSWVGRLGAYSAGACAAPGYGSMQPGCCEPRPGCHADVWDGYCQNKGCHKKHCGCPTTDCMPTCANCQPGVITPAMVPSAPAGSAIEVFSAPQPTVAPPAAGAAPQPHVAPAQAPQPPKPAK
jgi:hypothetical protein